MHRLSALVLGFLCAGAANAGIMLTASLTHDQETTQGAFTTSTGAPRPQSFGIANFLIDDAQTSMTFVAMINNIDFTGTQTADPFDNLTAAHIHGPALPGSNGPVIWGFFGMPDNDIAPDNLIFMPFLGGAVGGIISSTWNLTEGNGGTTFALQLANILDGLTYINFHTTQFRGGEIRGQILLVPEPATWLLIATAASLLLLTPVRKKVRVKSR